MIVTEDGTPIGMSVGYRAGTRFWENGPSEGWRRVVAYTPRVQKQRRPRRRGRK